MTRIGDTKLAEQVIDAYAEDLEGLTDRECEKLGFDNAQTSILKGVLGWGDEGVVTNAEMSDLYESGFSNEFILELGGNVGMKALKHRAKWLGEHAVKRWWRRDFGSWTREKMIHEIRAMGPAAAPTVPALIDALGYEDICLAALWALAKIGTPEAAAVPAIIVALGYKNEQVSNEAARALGEIGEPAVPALIDALGNWRGRVRQAAARALGKIGSAAEAAVPALIDALGDKKRLVRFEIIETLGKIGSAAEAAVPALIEGLGYECRYGCEEIVKALAKIGTPAVPALTGTLRDKDKDVREGAAIALGEIGSTSRAALPLLEIMARTDPDRRCRDAAAKAVEAIVGGAR